MIPGHSMMRTWLVIMLRKFILFPCCLTNKCQLRQLLFILPAFFSTVWIVSLIFTTGVTFTTSSADTFILTKLEKKWVPLVL